MSGRYAAYQRYAEAKIDWADSLPAAWDHIKLRWGASIYAGGTPSKTNLSFWENGTVPWLNSGSVNQGLIHEVSAFITQAALQNSSARWIKRGSLVVALAGQGKTKGMVAQLGIDATCNQSMAAIVPSTKLRPRFLLWWLSSNYQNVRNMAGGDLRDGLNLQLLGDIQCPLPTQQEQTQIAKFLDYETAKIDALIEKQQQLIALLKEKCQAVISHAVTKGFNPDAPMRDSGVEWLAEVPAHWEVSKFGFVSSVVRGGSPRPAGDPTLFNGDYSPWVTVAEITKDDEITLTETATFLTRKGSIQCRVFKAGTLLLSNSGATLGVPKVLMIDANANDGVVGFEDLKHHREYCYYYLSSLTEDLRERIKQGSGQPNLNTDIVKAIHVPVPPPDETDAIVSHISEQREKFKQLAEKAELGIELLQERRTALISAAVTGMIDVRGWQAPDFEAEAEVA